MKDKTQQLLKLELFLFLIAVVVAAVLVGNHYTILSGESGFHSFCSINKVVDCDAVNASQYAEIFGIPIATLGLAYYLSAVVFCLIALRSVYYRRESLLLLTALTAVSVIATLVTSLISVMLVKAICLFCVSLYVLNLLTFGVALLCWHTASFNNSYCEEWKNASRKRVIGMLVCGLVIFITVHVCASQTLYHPFPFDEDLFLAEYNGQPTKEVTPGNAPRFGFQGPNPPLQIVEFADFQCPACGLAAKLMHRLTQVYGNKVQLAFKYFPLDPSCNTNIHVRVHQYACGAAKNAFCAKKQGKFEPYYEKLFGNQAAINPNTIHEWASELGLDMKAFDECTASTDASVAVQKDIEQGAALGLRSTPTFFVNGKMIEGAIDEQRLRALLKTLGK